MHRIELGLEFKCVLTAILSSVHELCGDRNMAQVDRPRCLPMKAGGTLDAYCSGLASLHEPEADGEPQTHPPWPLFPCVHPTSIQVPGSFHVL